MYRVSAGLKCSSEHSVFQEVCVTRLEDTITTSTCFIVVIQCSYYKRISWLLKF